MSKSSIIFAFLTGAVAGSVAAWVLLKAKYEKITRDEVAAFKETYSNIKERERSKEKEDYEQLTEIYKSDCSEKEENEEVKKPYVISPEEFDEKDYDVVSLTYYADDVLTDDWGEVVDIENTVGRESLTHFGEYEDDSVFVRDDENKVDYEILLDERKYSEVK